MAFGMNYSAPTPYGTIVIWSGNVDAVPYGWHLCDGTGGTPDLRDRFVVGAGLSYAKGATGGEATHKLTVDEMPAHTHGVAGEHRHNLLGASEAPNGDLHKTSINFFPNATETEVWLSDYIVSSEGAHQHPAAGGNAAHENRPPYYALAYIMKVC